MAVKLLCVCLLLGLLCRSWAEEYTCLRSDDSCSACIQADPACAWCTDPDAKIHCDTREALEEAGCSQRHIYHPQGGVQVVRNGSRTEQSEAKTVFLQPQELRLSLRPGVGQSFPLTITLANDQPVTELVLDTSPLPEGVNITFNSTASGNPLVIQVNVEAAKCLKDSDQLQNNTGPWSVQITPRGFSLSLELQLTLQCQCDCMKDHVENSPACTHHGTLTCGKCRCNEPYIGRQCEMKADSDTFSLPHEERSCRSGPNAPLCSNRGHCILGTCECYKRENPAERYTGRYCECTNFDCPRAMNRLCGGHGLCECRQCICDAGWTGTDCSCSLETASCMATNQQLCNGRGSCDCGRCRCTLPFMGPTCEICPTCPGPCALHRGCVECHGFGTGSKKDRCAEECDSSITMVDTRNGLPSAFQQNTIHCKERDQNDCWFYFAFSETPSGKHLTIVRAKDCPTQSSWGK